MKLPQLFRFPVLQLFWLIVPEKFRLVILQDLRHIADKPTARLYIDFLTRPATARVV